MRSILGVIIAAVALGISGAASELQAQDYHDGGLYNRCLRAYYDPDNYNWYTFQNNCGETLYVVVCPRQPVEACQSGELEPGEDNNTGTGREGVRRAAGWIAFACREGYLPVDASGTLIRSGPEQRYRCKKRGW